jgi:hypothetical protein
VSDDHIAISMPCASKARTHPHIWIPNSGISLFSPVHFSISYFLGEIHLIR